MEALEREEELTDFVSTAKGVLQVAKNHITSSFINIFIRRDDLVNYFSL